MKAATAKNDTGIVQLHGREYKTVALRVTELRAKHPDWRIITEVLNSGDPVLMKASIESETGIIIGTGHAEEKRGSSPINKTSALENAETSAIGRALSACGYAGTEYASADEISNAINQEKETLRAVPPIPQTPSTINVDDTIADMQGATTLKLLMALYGTAYKATGGAERDSICAAYKEMKVKLQDVNQQGVKLNAS